MSYPPNLGKFAISQGRNGSTRYFCRATYWIQEHGSTIVIKRSRAKNFRREISDTPQKVIEVVFLGLSEKRRFEYKGEEDSCQYEHTQYDCTSAHNKTKSPLAFSTRIFNNQHAG